jgi:hypothetical protein
MVEIERRRDSQMTDRTGTCGTQVGAMGSHICRSRTHGHGQRFFKEQAGEFRAT